MEWYRRYVGTCADEKIAEAAMVGDAPRCLVIAVWDALLESACYDEAGGAYSTTPRRIAAVLAEPVDRVAGVLAALTEVGMIAGGAVVAWAKRQPNSETPQAAADRQRKSREARRQAELDAEATAKSGMSQPVTACHGVSRPVTAPEEEEETDSDPSAAAARGGDAGARREEPPNLVALPGLRSLGRDALEAECRLLMGSLPVVVDPDFSPVGAMIGRDGVERADALAACRAAADTEKFRPRSWRQLQGWVRRAAQDRLDATQPRIRDGPRRGGPKKSSNLAFLNRRAFGPDFDSDGAGEFAAAGPVGPLIEGRAGSG